MTNKTLLLITLLIIPVFAFGQNGIVNKRMDTMLLFPSVNKYTLTDSTLAGTTSLMIGISKRPVDILHFYNGGLLVCRLKADSTWEINDSMATIKMLYETLMRSYMLNQKAIEMFSR